MPMQDLTPLPTAPSRNDPPEVFIERADAWVAAMETLTTQLNTLVTQIEATAALIAVAPAYADAGLLAMTGKTPAADRLIYLTGTGAGASSLATFTAAGRALVDDADAAAQRTTLGLGTAATQASTAFETAGAVSGHVAAGDPHTQYLLESAVSAFIATLLDDADAATARTTLGALGVGSVSFGAGTIELTIPLSGSDTLLIQGGIGSLGANSGTNITYPTSYALAPAVVAGGGPSGTSAEGDVHISGTPTTSVAPIVNSSGNTATYTWFAIGKA